MHFLSFSEYLCSSNVRVLPAIFLISFFCVGFEGISPTTLFGWIDLIRKNMTGLVLRTWRVIGNNFDVIRHYMRAIIINSAYYRILRGINILNSAFQRRTAVRGKTYGILSSNVHAHANERTQTRAAWLPKPAIVQSTGVRHRSSARRNPADSQLH